MLHADFHQQRQREWTRELNRKLELSRRLSEAPVARAIPKPQTHSVRRTTRVVQFLTLHARGGMAESRS